VNPVLQPGHPLTDLLARAGWAIPEAGAPRRRPKDCSQRLWHVPRDDVRLAEILWSRTANLVPWAARSARPEGPAP
jgi:hypothetical protein